MPARINPSSSVDEGRFLPGTVLAGRYRVIALLGRGGMGEVYRATDLKLGQAVALKFLSEAKAHDSRVQSRFFGEVRLARQVSHPNVCRVYDIGEIEGQPYISMEYVDGENLGASLRRIGRLPADKAIEIGRKLCAGLAAAHDRGVLHRDLKPANIMIDARGQVLITDFGLAELSGDVRAADVRSGTPAYMAPEQLAGTDVTPASDIYALGLVLYEMFTGKRAFNAHTVTELMRLQKDSDVTTPTSVVKDLDPAVERVILRCLQREPSNRPPSALAVAAALPGGDPLAAALAAGETPSPEMVAAAGKVDGLRVRIAVVLLAVTVGSLALCAWLIPKVSLLSQVPFDHPPETLVLRSRDLLQKLGYTDRPVDTAYGFTETGQEFLLYAKRNHMSDLRAHIAKGQPPLFRFWYRQSSHGFLTPRSFLSDTHRFGMVTRDDPPQTDSGMTYLELDGHARLLHLEVVPRQIDEGASTGAFDWNVLLAAAALDSAKLTATEPKWVPPMMSDAQAAWTGTWPESPTLPLRVEAAAWRGRAVYFQMIGPWTTPTRMQQAETTPKTTVGGIMGVLFLLILAVSIYLARRNMRLGRGDRRGALRLSAFVSITLLASFTVAAHHVPGSEEVTLIFTLIAKSLLFGGTMWLFYIALEPYVRRQWPQTLIGWNRVLAGGWRDPLAGGDILIGVTGGALHGVLACIDAVLRMRAAEIPAELVERSTSPLIDARAGIASWLEWLQYSVHNAVWIFLFIFLLRIVLRKSWVAGLACVAVLAVTQTLRGGSMLAFDLPIWITIYAIGITTLLRFGLLAFTAVILCAMLLWTFPFDFSRWYAGSCLFVLLSLLALAMFAFHTTLAGRPVIRDDLLS